MCSISRTFCSPLSQSRGTQKDVFGGDWAPQRDSSPGEWLQRQSTPHCLGGCKDSGPLPSLPAPDGANWEHPTSCVGKRQVLPSGSPACCAVPDVLPLCCTGISLSQLSQARSHSHFKQSQEHLGPCSQMIFYLQVEMLVYLCDFPFPVLSLICMGMCSYL